MNKFVKFTECGNTFFSAITNTKKKLEILLHNTIIDVNFEKGRKIEVIGDIKITGFVKIIICKYI